MKLIKNTGSDRVIDELRRTLAPPSSLDLASPAFSLFAFAELRDLLEKLDACRVVLPANIAEGFRKQSGLDKARFLNISEGSLEECRYYLILAHDLGYLDKTVLWEQSEEVGRLLNGYRTAILNSNS